MSSQKMMAKNKEEIKEKKNKRKVYFVKIFIREKTGVLYLMKLSYNRLKKLLPNLNLSPKDLMNFMTENFAENDPLKDFSENFKDLEIGEVSFVEKLKESEKLFVAEVKSKNGIVKDILTGAPNLFVGAKVCFVREGGFVPGGFGMDGFFVKKKEIFRKQSSNILLSEKEIGLGEDHTKIKIFSKETKIGKFLDSFPFFADFQLVIDNKALSNRADCFSHIGVARELSTLLDTNLEFEIKDYKQSFDSEVSGDFFDEKCFSYSILEAEVSDKESNLEISQYLLVCGIRPISLIVDITNDCLVTLGQPLHAFDKEKIEKLVGKNFKLGVRKARSGEKIVTLDEKERNLSEEDLLIVANDYPIALAGVMGGKETRVDKNTKRVLVESAIFDPISIRKTALRHELKSEASIRFEHGIDPLLPEKALFYIAQLMGKYADKAAFSDIKTLKKVDYREKTIHYPKNTSKKILGFDLNLDEAELFKKIGCKVNKKENGDLEVIPPSFRLDFLIKEDLVEEVGRKYGVGNMKENPFLVPTIPSLIDPCLNLALKISRFFAGSGFNEVYSYSFTNEKFLDATGEEKSELVEVLNSPSKNSRYLRGSLVPNMLEFVEKNRGFFDEVRIFEYGHTYKKSSEKGKLPIDEKKERVKICFAIGEKSSIETVFRKALGVLKSLEKFFLVKDETFTKISKIDVWDESFGIKLRGMYVATCEIDLEDLLEEISEKEQRMKSPLPFPKVIRDVNFEKESSKKPSEFFQEIKEKIDSIKKEVDFEIEFSIVDIFTTKNSKKFTVRFFFFSEKRTLEEKEIETALKSFQKNINK